MKGGHYKTLVRTGWNNITGRREYSKQIVAWLREGADYIELRRNVPDNVVAGQKLQEELLQELKKLWVGRQVV